MTDHVFTFCKTDLAARADGTLWWAAERILCVSDLHLGKSERIARRGGTLLPPYETRETLWRLEAAIDATNPATVICLGDSFDDLGAARAISDDTRATLTRLQAGRDWIWIEGNHDPGPVELGGTHMADLKRGPLTFRHIATSETGEISGHYHPKGAIAGATRRPCFLIDAARIIMPAFGAYTGGLSARDDVLAAIMEPTAIAVLTGKSALPVPLKSCLKR
ncbi:ligase-associated DNA damage response endonuclease PdeM [Octadecabacter sp. G9-8]|uniref:Ligase-associated DNA damage response endonuclease PdeM n=1 Tax=Octadecabacter dasysiphoniae TaxID=2909341 RepID=A0ABS9CTN4_9RHOB|nr:ligase-associated DNA damage response endonuclease PdeM [Octadecabacter dasysiphoniae]MCF2869774.1 ligase-associated DNA damage response endonuclease PdeM [Octadecabacter dasysiphoniae]